jgi:transposase-like protein
VHTIEEAPVTSGRRRRKHSAEFKTQVVKVTLPMKNGVLSS